MIRFILTAWAFVLAACTPILAYAETPVVDDAGRELGENLSGRPLWITVLAGVVWLLVRFAKDPATPGIVPPRWRPLLALALALVIGGLESIVRSGLTWPAFMEGLQNGFMAAGGAVFLLQEVFIRGLLGGKTEPPPGPAPSAKTGTGAVTTIFMGALCLLLTSGCAGGSGQADRTIGAISESIRPLDDQLHAAFNRELGACGDEACLVRVKKEWTPIIETMAKIREAWCTIKASDCDDANGQRVETGKVQ